MTKEETARILSFLHADVGAVVREEKVEVWYHSFKHLPFELCLRAANHLSLRKCFGEYQKAEFVECLEEVMVRPEEAKTPDAAWEDKFSEPIAREALRQALGGQSWGKLLESEVPFVRKRFDKIYSELLKATTRKRFVTGDLTVTAIDAPPVAPGLPTPEQVAQNTVLTPDLMKEAISRLPERTQEWLREAGLFKE